VVLGVDHSRAAGGEKDGEQVLDILDLAPACHGALHFEKSWRCASSPTTPPAALLDHMADNVSLKSGRADYPPGDG